jgi:hypothetical protein
MAEKLIAAMHYQKLLVERLEWVPRCSEDEFRTLLLNRKAKPAGGDLGDNVRQSKRKRVEVLDLSNTDAVESLDDPMLKPPLAEIAKLCNNDPKTIADALNTLLTQLKEQSLSQTSTPHK